MSPTLEMSLLLISQNQLILLYLAKGTLRVWLIEGSWENYPGLPRKTLSNHWGPYNWESGDEIKRIKGDRTTKTEIWRCYAADFKDRESPWVKECSSMNWKRGFLPLKTRQQASNGVIYAKPTKPRLTNYDFTSPRNGILNHSLRNCLIRVVR